MTKSLGKLERVELRKVWTFEDKNFTPWLAEEANLELLSKTIGIDLAFEDQERSIGPFRADILCKSVDDDSWVLIENQIERSDHRHLGQLLTYAAGLQAETIVWIASTFTEEHIAALDRLNEITNEECRFFGLEIELWKIGDSEIAPKFNVVSKPNNWSKSISQATRRRMTETTELQYRYWVQFQKHIQDSGSKLKTRRPKPRHWYDFSVGRSGFHISALLNTRDKCITVKLSIKDPSKKFFNLLAQDQSKIEKEIGTKLIWDESPENPRAKILQVRDADPTKESDWQSQHDWFIERIETFDRVFRPRIASLDPEQWHPEED